MARRGSAKAGSWLSGFWARASLFLLILISLGLAVLHNRVDDSRLFGGIREAADEIANPPMQAVDLPLSGMRRAGLWVSSFWSSAAKVRELEQENQRLRQWESLSHALYGKILRYEELLDMRGETKIQSISTRLIAESHGPFVHSALLRAGTNDGITEGQAVVDPNGMVGRVVRSSGNSARVLLLNDLNSRIPVKFEGNPARAILAGDNQKNPKLIYITEGYLPAPGTRISTSGDDGFLPAGITIGETIAADPDKNASDLRVRLYANLATIDFVQVLGVSPALTPEEDMAAAAESTNSELMAPIPETAETAQ
jgi:rod shape-determining protein MreC